MFVLFLQFFFSINYLEKKYFFNISWNTNYAQLTLFEYLISKIVIIKNVMPFRGSLFLVS